MLVRFITDTGCDIPSLTKEVSSIKLLPLYFSINGTPYYENVNITLDNLSEGSLPLISEPMIPKQVYLEAILEAQKDGCSDIFIITPDKHLLGLYKEASNAASLYLRKKDSAGTKIHVIDSGTFSIGYGVPLASVVLDYEAGKFKTIEEIKKVLNKRMRQVIMFCRSARGCRIFKKNLTDQKADSSADVESFLTYRGSYERLTDLTDEEDLNLMNKIAKILIRTEHLTFFSFSGKRPTDTEVNRIIYAMSAFLSKIEIIASRKVKPGISASYIAGEELSIMILTPASNFELIDEVEF